MGNPSTQSGLQHQRVEDKKPSFMKKALLVTASVLLAMGILFYILIANTEHSTHLHFTTRERVFKNVVYYSATPLPTGVPTRSPDGNSQPPDLA